MNLDNWAPLPLEKKILNIAAELGRAANWLKRQDRPAFENSIERALELLDLSVHGVPEPMLREWLRFREWLAGTLIDLPLISDFSVARRCFLDLQSAVHELQLEL